MTQQSKPIPMQAKSATAVGSGVARSSRAAVTKLAATAVPEDVLDLLRQLVAEDQIGAARRLLIEADRRFPNDSKIQLARQVLAEGEPSPNTFVQPTVSAEIEWLRQPPQEARGKWIALIGSELVGMADTAEELMAALRSEHFEQLPVVQYIAA